MTARGTRLVLTMSAVLAAAGAWAGTAGARPQPPGTTITSGPSGTVSSSTATFSFRSTSDPRAAFQCSIDGGGWSWCASPKTYSSLGDGRHGFAVRASGKHGTDETPATAQW